MLNLHDLMQLAYQNIFVPPPPDEPVILEPVHGPATPRPGFETVG